MYVGGNSSGGVRKIRRQGTRVDITKTQACMKVLHNKKTMGWKCRFIGTVLVYYTQGHGFKTQHHINQA